MSDVSKYTFGKSTRKGSAGQFKTFVKKTYPKLKPAEVNEIVERYYSKDEGKEKLDESNPAST